MVILLVEHWGFRWVEKLVAKKVVCLEFLEVELLVLIMVESSGVEKVVYLECRMVEHLVWQSAEY